jgi:prepilin-type N-terminal cleavage/methylation domain-containing protein
MCAWKCRSNKSLKKGFTLVEVMVSFVVLGFLASVVGGWLYINHWTVVNGEAREQAVFKAQRLIDSLQARGIHGVANMTNQSINCTAADDVRTFTCKTTITTKDWVNHPMHPVDTTKLAISKRIIVDVEWEISSKTRSTRIEGIIE